MGVWCVSPPTDFTDLHRWLGCVCSPTEFTEFTEVLLCRYSHGIHRIHRSFIASVLPRNSRNSQKFGGAVGCVGMAECHTLLICAHPCASVRICGRLFSARNFCAFRGFCGNTVSHGFHRLTQMVGCVNSPTEFTDQHRWLVALIRPRNSQKFGGAVGCVGTAGCHTLLICAHLCASVEATSLPEGSVCSVRSVEGVSQPEECVLWEVLLNQKSESSVGDYSFSMRKRLTMPKTRA